MFGLAADAEVTTEANPESVDAASRWPRASGGFTRISFGMQSAVAARAGHPGPGALARSAVAAVAEARAAGFDQVSLDLIYGTPGESLLDWRKSLEAALGAEPDHVSAYALVVEEGTRMATRVRRGELPLPDDDDLADKYLLAEEPDRGRLQRVRGVELGPPARRRAAGTISATGAVTTGGGSGPARTVTWVGPAGGTSSTLPRTPPGSPPESRRRQAREILTADDRGWSRCCWRSGWPRGCPSIGSPQRGRGRLDDLAARSLVVVTDDRLRLTLTGRLLADAIVRELVD